MQDSRTRTYRRIGVALPAAAILIERVMIGAIFAGVGPFIAASLYGLWVKNGRLRGIPAAGAGE